MKLEALRRFTVSTGEIVRGEHFEAPETFGKQLIDEGAARRLPDADTAPAEQALNRWQGSTVVCIASGPSLDEADCEYLRDWRTLTGGHVIVVNSSFKRVPWADALVAADANWFQENDWASFRGEVWTQSEKAHVANPKIRYAPNLRGISSGHCAVELAAQWGAARIILLGYDMSALGGRLQWHEPHQNAVQSQPYGDWISVFDLWADDFKQRGITVVNCSRRSALKCFPRIALQDEIKSAVPAA